MEKRISTQVSSAIDVFRVIAAWFVMIGHGFSFFQLTIFKDQTGFCYIQNIGVVLLLLLSGFLLAYSMEKYVNSNSVKTNTQLFRDFCIKKICRIQIPLLFALLLVCFVDTLSKKYNPAAYVWQGKHDLPLFLGNFLLLQFIDIPGVSVPCFGSAAQLWTLAVEWWAYFPIGYLFIVFVRSIKNHCAVKWFHPVILAILSYPMIGYHVTGIIKIAPFIILFGFALFHGFKQLKELRFRSAGLAVLSLLLAVTDGVFEKDAYSIRFVLPMGLFFLFTLCAANRKQDRAGRHSRQVISFFAGFSYSLYLIHYSIFDLFYRSWLSAGAGSDHKLFFFFVSTAVSVVCSIVFSAIFEKGSGVIAQRIIGTKKVKS